MMFIFCIFIWPRYSSSTTFCTTCNWKLIFVVQILCMKLERYTQCILCIAPYIRHTLTNSVIFNVRSSPLWPLRHDFPMHLFSSPSSLFSHFSISTGSHFLPFFLLITILALLSSPLSLSVLFFHTPSCPCLAFSIPFLLALFPFHLVFSSRYPSAPLPSWLPTTVCWTTCIQSITISIHCQSLCKEHGQCGQYR